MNIVLFGDSFLERFGKNLINQLESVVSNSTTYNCAAGGWNSIDLCERANYIAKLDPDYIILSFGANDVAPWKSVVTLEKFKTNTESILQVFSASKIIMLLCPDVHVRQLSQTQQYNERLKTYYQSVQAIFEKYEVKCIDTNNILKGTGDYHESDGVHFNQLAYDKVITRISELIN